MLTRLPVMVVLLSLAPPACAQSVRPLLEAAQRTELDAAQRQAALADGIYVGGGLVGGAGLFAVLGASIAFGACAGSCSPSDLAPAEIALGVGGGLIAVGLITLLVATFVDQDAERWRRSVLSRDMGLRFAPMRAGAMSWWTTRW